MNYKYRLEVSITFKILSFLKKRKERKGTKKGKWNGNGKEKEANKSMPLNLGSQRKNWQNTEGFQDIEATLHDSIMLLLFNQSAVSDSVTPWTAACQASQSFSVSQRLLHLMSIESMMTFNHLTLFPPLLFLSSIFPSISVFSNELALHITWPKCRHLSI